MKWILRLVFGKSQERDGRNTHLQQLVELESVKVLQSSSRTLLVILGRAETSFICIQTNVNITMFSNDLKHKQTVN